MQFIDVRKPEAQPRKACHVPDSGSGLILTAVFCLLLAGVLKKIRMAKEAK